MHAASLWLVLLSLLVTTAIASVLLDTVIPEEENVLLETVIPEEETAQLVTLLQVTTGWKLGDSDQAGLDGTLLWPPQTCWRPSYKRDKLRDSCRAGYVDVMGKMCRISCPTGWVTCGLRPDRGLMCGQSDKDCREAKVEMFSSILSAVGQIAGLVVTAGASSTLAYALKVIEIYDNVKGFIDTLKLFKEDTGEHANLRPFPKPGSYL